MLLGCLAVTALYLAMVWGILYYAAHNESDAKLRQSTEEELAAVFVDDLGETDDDTSAGVSSDAAAGDHPDGGEAGQDRTEAAADGTSDGTDGSAGPKPSAEVSASETGEKPEDPDNPYDYEDTVYHTRGGVTYTPDYAKGEIDCVLEIPSIELRRGVYTGTREEIDYDLDIWMAVTARPDYELNKTHYVIYGHNYPVEDLSFNRLTEVRPPAYFTLTAKEGVYFYEVTDFFADWREDVTRDVVDNFDLPKQNCYILSCGRNEYRYKDIVVVGTLREIYKPAYFKAHRTEIVEAFENGGYIHDVVDRTEKPEAKRLKFKVDTSNPKDIRVAVLLPDGGDYAESVSVSVYDKDGITLKNGQGEALSFVQGREEYHIGELPPGEYVIGVHDMDEAMSAEYDVPEDMVLTVSDDGVRSEGVSEFHLIDYISEDMPIRYWNYVLIAFATVIWIVLLIVVLSKPKGR